MPSTLNKASSSTIKQTGLRITVLLCLSSILASIPASSATAQTVDSALSTDEAFVDSRVVFQIRISNAQEFEAPEIPEIDGLRIVSAGAPSRSSFLRIENGRRTSSVTMTYAYNVFPTQEGTFRIPEISILVDGKTLSTSPHTLSVSKSETGDLLFVELSSNVDKAYVGQPIKQKLRVLIQAFTDRELRVRLAEGNMWSLISEQTNWGPFSDRLVELAQNNRRPGGTEVLRKDSDGISQVYYSYEIEATTYPKRAGAIASGDVRVVVEYPTKLARSRSRSFFGMDEMMGRSSFSIQASRPISATASQSGIQILDVPSRGRPSNYRGAVGTYQLDVQADPKSVRVGEPISLRLIIRGDGPMELIEAPPLAEIPAMEKGFKLEEKTLAGFVQDDVKIFATTVRPKSDSVTEIPPIDFSFFDPAKESYVTVSSQPIPITVKPNESLSLDSVVAAKDSNPSKNKPWLLKEPKENDPQSSLSSISEMTDDTATTTIRPASYWPFLIAPLAAVIGALWFHRTAVLSRLSFSPSPTKALRSKIQQADVLAEIRDAMDSAARQGIVPEAKAREIGTECDRLTFSPEKSGETSKASLQRIRQIALTALPCLIFLVLIVSGDETSASSPPNFSLAASQARTLLQEAKAAQDQAIALRESDSISAQENLEKAIAKYELVAESGLRSAGLYRNLGDAYMQNADWGHALAAFEIAKSLGPSAQLDSGVRQRIEQVQQQLGFENPPSEAWLSLLDWIPRSWTWWLSIVTWTLFWVFVVTIFYLGNWRKPIWLIACGFCLFLAIGGFSLAQMANRDYDAIATGENSELRAADGEAFAVVDVLKVGEAVTVMDQRGDWARVASLASDRTGWIKSDKLYFLEPKPVVSGEGSSSQP